MIRPPLSLNLVLTTVMSFAATFGSVGDFITVCQLIAQVSKALGDGYGSSSIEYQDLRRELDTFAEVVKYVGTSSNPFLWRLRHTYSDENVDRSSPPGISWNATQTTKMSAASAS